MYHGCRTSINANPNEFWKTYFTSSKTIHELIKEYGDDSFEIIDIIEHPNNDAYEAETKFLIEHDCANSDVWLNKSNNDYNLCHSDKEFKKRMIAKYGVDHNMKSEKLILERYKIHESKYGVYHVWQRVDIKDKIKMTNIDKYGVPYPMQSDVIKNKVYSTNIMKYGVACVFANDDIKKKICKTFDMKYGCHPRKLKITDDKRKITCISKYGVDSFSKTDEFKTIVRNKVWDSLSNDEKETIRNKSRIARQNDPVITCEYCCMSVKNKGTFNRFHGNNCKLNIDNINNIVGDCVPIICEYCNWFPKTAGERSNMIRHIKCCKLKYSK